MPSVFPDAYDSFEDTNPTDARNDPSLSNNINLLMDAHRKVQTTLGLNPEGTFDTVADRLGNIATTTVPSGTIMIWGGPFEAIPSGWAPCHGQTVNRVGTYASLFAAIGESWGAGDGSTTFRLPDFRARMVIGPDASAGRFASATQGAAGGAATLSLTVANLPSHNHGMDHDHPSVTSSSAGAHNHAGVTGNSGSHSHTLVQNGNHYHNINDPGHFHYLNDRVNALASGHTGLPMRSNHTGTDGGQWITTYSRTTGISIIATGNHSHTVNSAGMHNHTIGTQAAHTHTVDVPAFTGNTSSTGSGTAISLMNPWASAYYMIKI